jgi:hypothetical protein
MDGVTAPAPEVKPPLPLYGDPRKRRVLLAVALAWAVLLATAGIWYSFHGRPTAREQTTIAQAQPVVDRAIENVIRAAGAAALPAVSGFEKVSDCHVTLVRGGVTYERTVWLYTTVGTEPALLDRIAANLPGGYYAHAHHQPEAAVHTLTADAGYFVTVNGTTSAAGLVTVRAGTGCRTPGQLPAADPTTGPAADPLGISGAWRVHTLPCGLRTVEVTGPAARPLRTLPRAAVAVVSTDDVYADRSGRAAHTDGGTVTLSATTGTCGG